MTITFDPAHPLVDHEQCLQPRQPRHRPDELQQHRPEDLDRHGAAIHRDDAFGASIKTTIRARGNLVVTQPPGSYIINTRPFYDLESELGAVNVNVTEHHLLQHQWCGVYTGPAGLAALGALPINSSVAAYGTLGDLSTITPTFNATQVYAGTSLESELGEYVLGTVTSRSRRRRHAQRRHLPEPAG